MESFLDLMLVYLLKIHGWPDSPSVDHWRAEVGSFQKNATRRFAPSMRQRIDVAKLYADAREQLDGVRYDGVHVRAARPTCPFILDMLLTERRPLLEAAFDEP